MITHGGRIELPLFLLQVYQVFRGVLLTFIPIGQLATEVLIHFDHLTNIFYFLLLLLWLLFLLRDDFWRGFASSIIPDTLGLRAENVLQQFDEGDFLLHLLLHHFPHIGILFRVELNPVIVALQLI